MLFRSEAHPHVIDARFVGIENIVLVGIQKDIVASGRGAGHGGRRAGCFCQPGGTEQQKGQNCQHGSLPGKQMGTCFHGTNQVKMDRVKKVNNG